jgi:hypothetical protein
MPNVVDLAVLGVKRDRDDIPEVNNQVRGATQKNTVCFFTFAIADACRRRALPAQPGAARPLTHIRPLHLA